MRDNSRVRRQRTGTGTALGAGQTAALLAAAVAMLGGAFVLGVTVGRRASVAPAAPAATQAALDRLDDPLAVREEPAPELKAPQALTDARPIEKAMPLAPAKLVPPPAPAAPAVASPPAGSPAPAAAPVAKAPPGKPAAHASPDHQASPDHHPSPDHHAAYAIQVASSPVRADAERIAAKLAGKNPRIVAAEVPGKGRVYRVQVGAFPSHDAATRQLPQLARAGVRGIVVTAQR